MPWVRVWIHFVWSTKNREPYLNSDLRQEVFAPIRQNARAKNIHIDSMNGYVDHVHCLVSLGTDQTIEKIIQLIKGELGKTEDARQQLNAILSMTPDPNYLPELREAQTQARQLADKMK